MVEANSIIAPGAVVGPGQVVPAGQLWAESPAKMIRALTAAEIASITDVVGQTVIIFYVI